MTGVVGNLKTDATDAQSRHYEKTSARKRDRLNNFPFCWLRCKPTAVRLEVGLFGAGRVSGRASNRCDTMDATRDTTNRVEPCRLDTLDTPLCFQCAPARTPPSPLDGTPPLPGCPPCPLRPDLSRLAVFLDDAPHYGVSKRGDGVSKPLSEQHTRIVGGESW